MYVPIISYFNSESYRVKCVRTSQKINNYLRFCFTTVMQMVIGNEALVPICSLLAIDHLFFYFFYFFCHHGGDWRILFFRIFFHYSQAELKIKSWIRFFWNCMWVGSFVKGGHFKPRGVKPTDGGRLRRNWIFLSPSSFLPRQASE